MEIRNKATKEIINATITSQNESEVTLVWTYNEENYHHVFVFGNTETFEWELT